MMQHKLSDFCREISCEDPPKSWDMFSLTRICAFKQGLLVIYISVPERLSAEAVIHIELWLEARLSNMGVLCVQKTELTDSGDSLFAEYESWIVRHAKREATMESRMISCGGAVSGEACWILPQLLYDYFAQHEVNWLQDFWNNYGPFPCRIEMKASDEAYTAAPRSTKRTIQSSVANQNARTPVNPQTPPVSRKEGSANLIWGKKRNSYPLIKLSELTNEERKVRFVGRVFECEHKVTQRQNGLIKFSLSDGTNSVSCILFPPTAQLEQLVKRINGAYLECSGVATYTTDFDHDFQVRIDSIHQATAPQGRQDLSERKRVELHMHSKMSSKDATISPADIVRTAAQWGHSAVAITDHGNVQAFPEAAAEISAQRKAGKSIKMIYGMEGYLVDDGTPVVLGLDESEVEAGFVCLELLTDGPDPKQNHILKLEALRFDDLWLDRKSPERFSIDLGSSDCFSQEDCLTKLAELSTFIGQRPIISTAGILASDFLRYESFRVKNNAARSKFNQAVILLEEICQRLDESSSHELGLSFEHIKDCNLLERATSVSELFRQALILSEASDLADLNRRMGWLSPEELRARKSKSNHIILLVEDELGLYNLYRMVSASNLRHFYRKPRIPVSLLRFYRSGLILGAACVYGEVFSAILDLYTKEANYDFAKAKELLNQDELLLKARRYDYLEVQPLSNNAFLLRDSSRSFRSKEDLENLNRLVLALGEIVGRPICATGDVHFLNPEDEIYRRILLSDMNMDDGGEESAALYFRTSEEMLEEFNYLGAELAEQIVIENPAEFASRVSPDILPFPKGSYPPIIQVAASEVERLCRETAAEYYGRGEQAEIPEEISARITRELDAIIGNGYAIMYYIAQALVIRSNEDGYIVGSRGSVGSSFAAYLLKITEVNPLPPHYLCPQCHYYEEVNDGTYGSGFDLPERVCPHCSAPLKGDGQDIPFETFLGFDGSKQPDIDLNFSGEYQARAHDYIETMFGSNHTFRAGTISGYADKNSQAMVAKYYESQGILLGNSELKRLAQGISGVKRTSGQHPGGIVVLPKEREIYDFTPVQYPADKKDSGVITTHFDFNAMHDTILKLDVLGHDDPTMLKKLGDLCDVRVQDIPIPDQKVMSLFHSQEALQLQTELSCGCATIGLPEVGTMLARDMIAEAKPRTFYDLVQISGLSHGEGVWKGNAQDLIKNGICTIREVIGCRDSIMTTLIYYGLESLDAFDIMERVRKGKGLTEAQELLMQSKNVPEWYIESCRRIRYMFPKAHAAAYMISTLRIAWFKVYQPEAYYSAYFTIRADEFTYEDYCRPKEEIRQLLSDRSKNFFKLEKKDHKKFYLLELVAEMQARGIDFLPLSLKESRAEEFYSPEKGWIRPPLSCVGKIAVSTAEQICAARKDGGDFDTIDELRLRAGLGAGAIEALREVHLLDKLPESAQLDFLSAWG